MHWKTCGESFFNLTVYILDAFAFEYALCSPHYSIAHHHKKCSNLEESFKTCLKTLEQVQFVHINWSMILNCCFTTNHWAKVWFWYNWFSRWLKLISVTAHFISTKSIHVVEFFLSSIFVKDTHSSHQIIVNFHLCCLPKMIQASNNGQHISQYHPIYNQTYLLQKSIEVFSGI